MASKKAAAVVAKTAVELSTLTLQVAHQALAAVPTTNAQQARVLAQVLGELEAALAERQVPVPAAPVAGAPAAE